MKYFANLLVVLLAISLCLPVVAHAQETTVTVPDENLAAALRNSLELGANAPITQEALEGFTRLILSSRNITNLTGLEYATNLASLDLGDNNISDVTPLAGLTDLTTLYLAGNNITDFSPLLSLTTLQTVDVDFSALWMPDAALRSIARHALDLSEGEHLTIAKMANLTSFAVSYTTSVADLTGLEYATNLTELFFTVIHAGGFTDLSPIADLTGITTFLLAAAQVTDLTPLAGMVNMEKLNLQQNGDNISDITPLQGMVNLKELNLYENNISDLSPLKDLRDLEILHLSQNNVSEVSGLEGLVSLKRLSLEENNISDVSPLQGVVNLKVLTLSENNISDLSPLKDLRDLEVLYLSQNNVTDISALEGLVNLKSLRLKENNISDVSPLAGLWDLTNLLLEGNPIIDTSPLYPLTLSNLTQTDIDIFQYAPLDVNQDGSVDNIDVGLVVAALGQTGDGIENLRTDVNGDGSVDNADLMLIDGEAPGVTVSVPSLAQNKAFDITIVFSEVVSGFEKDDISLSDSTTTARVTSLTATDDITYTATITPIASGDVVISIPAGAAMDVATNLNTAAETQTVIVDMDAPSVEISVPSGVQSGAFDFTITFSESVSFLVESDVFFAGSTVSSTITTWTWIDPDTYNGTITPTASGDVVISIPKGTVIDDAVNQNIASETHTVTVDMDAPTVTVSAPTVAQKGAFDITFTFSEAVSGFEQAEVSLADSTATASVGALTTADNIIYTTTVTPTTSGTVSLSVPASVATDAAGNANTASERRIVTIDMDRPTVNVSAPTVAQKGAFDITFTFSEAVSGFEQAEVSLANNTATASVGALTTADNIIYTTTVTPTTSGTVSLRIPANVATDAAGNANTASERHTITVTMDGPIVSVSTPGIVQKGEFNVVYRFSEVVSGFEQADISLAGSTATVSVGALTTKNNIVYWTIVTPTTSGDLVVSVPAGAATDAAGKENTASETYTVTVDIDGPVPTVIVPMDPQSGAFQVKVTFNELVRWFTDVDQISFSDSTAEYSIPTWGIRHTGIESVDYTYMTINVEPITSGNFVISVPEDVGRDYAGNLSTASGPHTVIIDMDAPTLTVSAPTVAQSGAFDVTITFSEAVSGFEQAEVSLANNTATASVGALTTTDNIIYTTTVTPTTSGTVSLSVPASVATDAAGNANTASETHTITVTLDGPIVSVSAPSIVQSDVQKEAFSVVFTFSEAVSGFEQADISLAGSTATVSVGALTTENNIVYWTMVTPTTSGTLSISVPAGAATDAAGKENTASETYTVTVDIDGPVPTVIVPMDPQSGAFQVKVTFNELVRWFTDVDQISFSDSTAEYSIPTWRIFHTGIESVDYTYMTIEVEPITSGNFVISVPKDVGIDHAGNLSTASGPHTVIIDMDAPTLTVSAPTVAQSGAFGVTITFSEAVSGFEQAEVSLANNTATASVGALTTTDNIIYTTTVTPTTSGTVSLSVPASVATDAAGNANTASGTHTITVNISDGPSVTVSAPTVAQSGAFDVTITFSEAVSGFEQADVSLADSTATASITAWNIVDTTTYTATITPTTSGDVVISIPADVATNAADNANTASDTHTVTVDMDAPTVRIFTPRNEWNEPVTQSEAFNVRIKFSEAVSGFEPADVSLADSSATATVTSLDTSNNITYTAKITPTASGAVYINILEGVATDAAGNLNTAAYTDTVAVSIPGGDTVDIPDTQLTTILRGYLNLTVNQPITTEGLKGLIWLNANTASITDLTGLEHAINLTWVLMTRNNVSDISDLAGLTNLTELYLSDNNVSDISYLAGLTNLTNLALHNNSISDISYLAGLTRLKDLRLHNNSISDISALAGLTDLTWLLLSGNPILDTSPIFPLLEANGGKIKPNLIDISVSQYPPWDVNTDGSVDATDSALVTAALGQIGVDIVNPRTDVDGDGDVDNDDVLLVTNNLDEEVEEDLTNARAPVLLDSAALRNLSPAALEARLAALRAESDGSLKYSQAIALLESVLAELRPDETILLANYPNPFNPETWLPYHLANASDVRITIYDARGSVMRRLELGHQTAGYYTSRSRAAYWDGANEVGERVASGIYFYQLEADNHSFLRKMLILK